MFLYNLTMLGFMWGLKTSVIVDLKTLYSLSMFGFDSFNLLVFTILLFSLAGVPPFLGFFSKIFLMNMLVQYGFFVLYCLLYIILIFGLYFYMQNLRFLHSTNHRSIPKAFLTLSLFVTSQCKQSSFTFDCISFTFCKL